MLDSLIPSGQHWPRAIPLAHPSFLDSVVNYTIQKDVSQGFWVVEILIKGVCHSGLCVCDGARYQTKTL